MSSIRKKILTTFLSLMNNLGLPYRLKTVLPLRHEKIYLNIFQTLFPEHILQIMKIASENQHAKGDRIQSLIDFLSKDILGIDLPHIRGNSNSRVLPLKIRIRSLDREAESESYLKLSSDFA